MSLGTVRRAAARALAASVLLLVCSGAARASGEAIRCDGQTDDAPAINARLAALGQSGGGALTLPAGVCVVRQTLMVPGHVTLEGQGAKATLVQAKPKPNASEVDFPVIQIGAYTSEPVPADDAVVRDLTSDGGATTHAKKRLSGEIYVAPGSHNDKILRVEARNAGDNGVETNGIGTEIADSYVHDSWTNGVYVIGFFDVNSHKVYKASEARIHDNRVAMNSLTNRGPDGRWTGKDPSWDGIDVDPLTRDCVIEHNVVEGNDIILFENGVHIDHAEGIFGHKIINNVVYDSPENGVDISGYVHHALVEGNRLYYSVGWGVMLNTSGAHNLIKDNFILGATNGGILLDNFGNYDGTPTDWEFVDNVVVNPGASSGAGPGYMIKAGANVRIRGGSVTDNRPTKYMNVAVDSASPRAEVVVSGVKLCPGAAGLKRAKSADSYRDIVACAKGRAP